VRRHVPTAEATRAARQVEADDARAADRPAAPRERAAGRVRAAGGDYPNPAAVVNVTGDAVKPGGGTLLVGSPFTIAAGKRLDLTHGKMVLSKTPLGTVDATGTYTSAQGLVQSGYHGGAWDGPGLVTSMPDAQADRGITTLAVATADEVFYAGGTFGGVDVRSGDVLLMYTYAGDLNMDGLVDGADYGLIDNYVQFPGTSGYSSGDINYDGVIDGADYGIIDNAVQLQGAPFPSGTYPASAGVTAVPEPASLPVLGVAAAASWLGPRRRADAAKARLRLRDVSRG
jgi:hypothetical protein